MNLLTKHDMSQIEDYFHNSNTSFETYFSNMMLLSNAVKEDDTKFRNDYDLLKKYDNNLFLLEIHATTCLVCPCLFTVSTLYCTVTSESGMRMSLQLQHEKTKSSFLSFFSNYFCCSYLS